MKLNLNKLKTYSLKKRKSKVEKKDLAKTITRNSSFKAFYNSLPNFLAAANLRKVVSAIIRARERKKPVLFFMGAHVIKCGLSPIVNALLREGIISHLGANGACLIHDYELAYSGKTSEEVDEAIKDGSFGMARETAIFLNQGAKEAYASGQGLGCTIGKKIQEEKLPYRNLSIFAECYRRKVSSSVHVAIGTDIIHQHPSCDGAAIGAATYQDFKILIEKVMEIGNGGVILNFGSAVMMPEVFLKALAVARNLKGKIRNFTTANFDMLYHYRPQTNIVRRPVLEGGEGYYLVGHHEIMLPLLAAGVFDNM